MKLSFILLIAFLSIHTFGQTDYEKEFKKLKYFSCDDFENGSEKIKQRCFLIDVVNDSLDYMPSQNKFSEHSIISGLEAYRYIRESFEYPAKQFCCWTEYNEYFVFAFDWGLKKKICAFYCIVYVKKGEKEFRLFVPRT